MSKTFLIFQQADTKTQFVNFYKLFARIHFKWTFKTIFAIFALAQKLP